MNWFYLSVAAFLFFGLQNFFFKVSAERGLNSRSVIFYYILFSVSALWAVYLWRGGGLQFSRICLILGFLDSIAYFMTAFCRLEALRFIPTHLAMPLLRMSICLVVMAGTFLFGEPFTWKIFAGLLLTFGTVFLIHYERHEDKIESVNYRLGLILMGLAIIGSAGAHTLSKFAAVYTGLLDYMVVANSFIVLISFLEMRVVKGDLLPRPTREEIVIAIGIATVNLLGWICYLVALRQGPLNAAGIITGLAFIVPIILAAFVYNERLSKLRILAILSAALAAVILKS